MTVATFLSLLFCFSIVSSLVTEAAKKFKTNFSSTLLALIIALVIGCGGTVVYYILSNISMGVTEVTFAILLGLTSGLCSCVGYDKVKDCIKEITKGA